MNLEKLKTLLYSSMSSNDKSNPSETAAENSSGLDNREPKEDGSGLIVISWRARRPNTLTRYTLEHNTTMTHTMLTPLQSNETSFNIITRTFSQDGMEDGLIKVSGLTSSQQLTSLTQW